MPMITFNIEATMEEEHVNSFCSLLKYIEHNDNLEESTIVGLRCGGNKDFHPKFNINTEFDLRYGNKTRMFDIDTVKNIVHKCIYEEH